jgi:hypothetical protein
VFHHSRVSAAGYLTGHGAVVPVRRPNARCRAIICGAMSVCYLNNEVESMLVTDISSPVMAITGAVAITPGAGVLQDWSALSEPIAASDMSSDFALARWAARGSRTKADERSRRC